MDQKRFILAAVLSLAVILVWQRFFAPKPPEPPNTKKGGDQAAGAQPDAGSNTSTTASSGPDRPADAGTTASAADTGVPSSDRPSTRGDAGDIGADSAGGNRRPDKITGREERAWGTCLTAIPERIEVAKIGRETLSPDPERVSCDENECVVSSRVARTDGGDPIPFTCKTRDGTVESFSKSKTDVQDATENESNKPSASTDSQAAEKGNGKRPNRDVSVASHVMKSEHVRVKLTNARTGRLTSIKLLKPSQYKNHDDFLKAFPPKSKNYPFGIRFTNDVGSLEKGAKFDFVRIPNNATFEFVESDSKSNDDGDTYERVTYRYADPKGRFVVDKIFEWSDENPYVLKMDVRVENLQKNTRIADRMTLDIFGYKDPDKETSFLNFRPNQIKGICRMASEVKRWGYSEMEGPVSYDKSKAIWGAIATRYFMKAAIPLDGAQKCDLKQVGKGYFRTRLTYDEFTIPGEGNTSYSHKLYLGPKDTDVLYDIGEEYKLGSSIDYGLFAFIARPLRWALDKIYSFVGNWGFAIILLTVVIKLLTWPINMKAYRNMEDMKDIQPELEEIRDKYEDDQQRMTEETMKLFRENDVSPLGGCLPMVLQMPILYGLYVMIYSSVELYHADFLWYTNLAAPDPNYILPIVMGVVMFVQQGMMTNAGGNKQAQIMSKVMPFMFTGFMLFLPAGLVLYYSINLIISLGQQFYIRGFEPPEFLKFGDDD